METETEKQKELRLYREQVQRVQDDIMAAALYNREFPNRCVDRAYNCMDRMDTKDTLTPEIIDKIEKYILKWEGRIK